MMFFMFSFKPIIPITTKNNPPKPKLVKNANAPIIIDAINIFLEGLFLIVLMSNNDIIKNIIPKNISIRIKYFIISPNELIAKL